MMDRTARRGVFVSASLVLVLAIEQIVGVVSVRAAGTFRGVAVAEAVRVTVEANGAPVTNSVADGGSPVAQASLDSLGSADAFGSVLYPGDVVVTAPGLIGGLTGGDVSVPSYPLIAAASTTGSPSSAVDAPGASAAAEVSTTEAVGRAASGGQNAAGGTATATSTSSVTVKTGEVEARAAAETRAVIVGPLTIGRIATTAAATLGGDGSIRRQSSFEATGVFVGGIAVGVTADGLTVAGSNVPLPDRSPIQQLLDDADIDVRYVAPRDTPDGVVSGALVVHREQALPGAITPADVTYTFGRSRVSIMGDAGDLVTGSDGAAVGSGPIASTTPVAAGTAAPSVDVGGAPPDLPSTAVAPSPTQRENAAPLAPASATAPARFDLVGFYLVLVAGAVLAGVVLQLIRHFGVRPRWS